MTLIQWFHTWESVRRTWSLDYWGELCHVIPAGKLSSTAFFHVACRASHGTGFPDSSKWTGDSRKDRDLPLWPTLPRPSPHSGATQGKAFFLSFHEVLRVLADSCWRPCLQTQERWSSEWEKRRWKWRQSKRLKVMESQNPVILKRAHIYRPHGFINVSQCIYLFLLKVLWIRFLLLAVNTLHVVKQYIKCS